MSMIQRAWTAFIKAWRRPAEQRDLLRKHQERLESERLSRVQALPSNLQRECSIGDSSSLQVHATKGVSPQPRPETGEQLPIEFTGNAGAEFQRPPALLLDPAKGSSSLDIELLKSQAAEIEKKLRLFSIVGKVVHWSPGPVVTTFEFQPDASVALKSIINHSEDLCMALKATSLRVDRIPGKSTVGIEVTNSQRATVSFREIIESDAFRQHPSPLALALGKRMDGAPFVADLAQMPHLLIAGTTGSGKSVGLNSIVTSLLFRCTPEECRLVLIDPKRVELGLHADIPHLLTPVVTEPKLAINAVKWAVREMEERYKLLAACSVRNIMQFNRLVKDATTAEPPGNVGIAVGDSRLARPLPYIVLVIDSFEILCTEESQATLWQAVEQFGQSGAAVGIHLVIAIQRPSANILTGTIKANIPARIAFKTTSILESQIVLDHDGAENLLGMGDMLFLQPGSSQLLRLHGAYLSESEVGKVAKYLKRQGAPQYDESVLHEEKSAGAEGVAGMVDEADSELFEKACELAIQMGELSATLFQNRLRLGQARSRRIFDYLDQMGLLGPVEAGKPRKVNVEKTMEVLNKVRSAGILGGVPESGKTVDLDEPMTLDSSLD